jgi:transposase
VIRQRDMERRRFWQRNIREAARSGMSVREFCRRRRLKESQFYWWRSNLGTRSERRRKPLPSPAASFALVSEGEGMSDAGIELVLGDGRRLRIRQGVDEETLRSVLAALEPARC